jgi:leucyl aminopeptidase
VIPDIRFRTVPRPGWPVVLPLPDGAAPPAAMAEAARLSGFRGRTGEAVELLSDSATLLVGLGRAAPADLRAAGALACARWLERPRLVLDVRGLPPASAAALAAAACGRAWRTERWRSAAATDGPVLRSIEVAADDAEAAARAFAPLAAVLAGADRAREWSVAPANALGPAEFALDLAALSREGLEAEVLTGKDLRRAGLGGLIAVGAGSARPPALVALRWRGTTGAPPLLLVGKGLCFDTGGVCIKPAARMEDMRGDMAGAAACAGAMLALARRRSPAHVVAVLPLAENATGAASFRPADVLRMADGSTVEVVDTDAEGRLVLADAMTWGIARFRPQASVTVATLTGAITVALGSEMAGLFANDDGLAGHVAAAGAQTGERVWRMPIGARHAEDLRSDIADLRHCTTGRFQPDASHAAAFLRAFAGDTPWAHLDIAGVDLRLEADDTHAVGPTGFGVALLDRLAALRFEDAHRA